MIVPTNGRVVWYTPAVLDGEMRQHDFKTPLTAQVCHVWHDRMVNLDVTDSDGRHFPRLSVALLQDDDPKPDGGNFAVWMPYQKGQAAKHEALEAKTAPIALAEPAAPLTPLVFVE